jgi:hypothetical protein
MVWPFDSAAGPEYPELKGRVAGAVAPTPVSGSAHLRDPEPSLFEVKSELLAIRKDMAGLLQALEDHHLASLTRSDWTRTFDVDTSVAVFGLPLKLMAQRETGGRPFSGFKVISVGGGALVASINGDAPVPLTAGDNYRDEIIWSLEVWTTSAAAGTARIRCNAYTGRR